MRAEERELPMGKATTVNTCLGVLKGRDCIYLDQVKQDALNNLIFTGDINGHLVSQHRDEKDWFSYTLTFRQVLAYFTCELDTYENLAGTEYLDYFRHQHYILYYKLS